jgi:sugar phosphate permease
LTLLVAPLVTGLAIVSFAAVAGFRYFAFVPLMIAGIGYVATNVAGAKSVLVVFSKEQWGLVMGLRAMGNSIGDVLAAAMLPAIALTVGWRWGVEAAGTCAIGAGLVTWFSLGRTDREEQGKQRGQTALLPVLRTRGIWASALMGFTLQGAHFAGITFLVLYGREALGYGLVAASGLLSAGVLAAGCGRIAWGLISDRLFDGRRLPAMQIVAAVGCLAGLGFALAGPGTPHWVASLLAGAFGVSVMGNSALRQNFASETVEPAAAGLALGIQQTAAVLGAMVCPPTFGWLADATGSYSTAWGGLSIVLLGLPGLMCFLLPEHRSGTH